MSSGTRLNGRMSKTSLSSRFKLTITTEVPTGGLRTERTWLSSVNSTQCDDLGKRDQGRAGRMPPERVSNVFSVLVPNVPSDYFASRPEVNPAELVIDRCPAHLLVLSERDQQDLC